MIHQSALTIFPTVQRLSMAVDELLVGDGDKALVASSMMTFGSFERRLRSQILGPSRALSGFGRSLLLASVISDFYRGRPGVFKPAMTKAGFNAAFLSFFDELGAGLVSLEDMSRLTGYAPSKEMEIRGLYEAYTRRLEKRGYMDEITARRRLVEALDSEEAFGAPVLRGVGRVTLRDIYQFTPYRFELIRKIARRIPVTIVAPLPDSRRKAFGFIVSNIEKFESLAGEEGMLDIRFEDDGEGPLEPLRRRIFDLAAADKAPGDDLAGRVEILKCSSRYREVEEAGARIIALREEAGARWGDFAVIFRDVTPYAPIVEDVFRRYRIPLVMKRGARLSHNPLVRSVISIFEALDSGFERESVLRIVSSPYFHRFSEIDEDSVRAILLGAKIISGPSAAWSAALKKAERGLKKDALAQAKKTRAAVIDLLRALERFGAKNKPSDFFPALGALLGYLGLAPATNPEGPMAQTITFRDHSALARLRETMAEAEGFAKRQVKGAAAIGFDGLRGLFESHLELKDIPDQAAADRNRVFVLGAHDAVGARFKFVFAPGLHEGEFPRYIETGSILSEAERERFNAAHAGAILGGNPILLRGRRVFDRAADKWREESLLFFQALRAAENRIVLTYSEMELDGAPLLRSQFIDDVLDVLLPGAASGEREAYLDAIKPPSLVINKDYEGLIDTGERVTRLLRDIFRGDGDAEKLEGMAGAQDRGKGGWARFTRLLSLSAMERGRDEYFHEGDPAARASLVTPHAGLVESAKELVRASLVEAGMGRYSPTDLEKLGQCPFRYFAARLLYLEPVKEPELSLDALEAGSLYHAILEDFYGRLIAKGLAHLSDEDELRPRLYESAWRVFAKMEEKGEIGDPAIWETEKEKALVWLALMLGGEAEDRQKSGFIPAAVEARFDSRKTRGEAWPPHEIRMGDGSRRFLVGAIDRIDIHPEKKLVRVIDYKSGSNATRYRALVKRENMGVTSFQLPVYMILAVNHVKSQKSLGEARGVTGGYRLIHIPGGSGAFILTGGGRSKDAAPVDDGVFLARPGAAEGEACFESLAIAAIGEAESGRYPVNPRSCEYCDFAPLCRLIDVPAAAAAEEA